MKYDVIIIGSGPAGITAGIYLSRFKRKVVLIEGDMPGGQLMTTGAVENWPGNISIDGPELMKNMREQALACGAEFLPGVVTRVDFSSKPVSSKFFSVFTKNNKELNSKSVIIATGSSPKKLGVKGEKEYWGKGVNVCATCDAPLYKGREVVVVGGGNSAIAESYALSKHAKKVTILQVREKLSATDPLLDKVLSAPNIDVICNQKVIEIKGDDKVVTKVILENQKDKSVSEMPTQGVFVAIGMSPNSDVFKGQVDIDDRGYIIKNNGQQTSQSGVFVAGDVDDFLYRQAITASGQGCAAALECEKFLRR